MMILPESLETHFTYSPRNQNPRLTPDIQVPKRLSAQNVLQRDSLPPLLDELPDSDALGDGRRVVADVLADPAELVGGGF
jgi:hypothetical protein